MAIETATPNGTQDVEARLEAALYPEDEPAVIDDDEVNQDDDQLEEVDLPEDDDPDSDDDEGSIDEDDQEDLTLADYLGVDEDRIVVGDDGSVSLNTIIDGESKPVDLKELVSSYQLQGHVNNQSIALSEERKEFEGIRTQAYQQLKEKMDGLDALSKVLEQDLVAEHDTINWEQLRVENPAEWTALRQEFAMRAQRIQQAQGLILQQQQQTTSEQAQAQQAEFQKLVGGELEKMIADNPEWADQAKREEAQANIRKFMSDKYGFSDDDMKSVFDHRVIKVIKDAMLFHEGKKSAEDKKNKQVPNFKKPGASRKQAQALKKARAIKAKKTTLRKTGSLDDAAALLVDRM